MPRGDQNQVVYVDGDVPQLPIQLGQLLVDSSQISPGNTNLQQCTSQNPVTYEPLQGGYPITPAEIATGVTIVDYHYPPGDIRRYGAERDDVTDDYQAIQDAIDVMEESGGGRVFGWEGATTLSNSTITVKARVEVDLEGGTMHFALSGANDVGFQIRSYATVENGTAYVTSSGSPGSQGGIHAPLKVGPLYGTGGTVANPSPDEGSTGWIIRNLTAWTDADDHVAIGGLGGVNNGLIENITIPDSSHMSGAIGLDWGFLGTISSSDTEQYNNHQRWLAGTAKTTHPNNIIIRNIKIGNLTRASAEFSNGIRLSAVHNITIENVSAKGTQYAGFFHTAGDLGYEFADPEVQPFAHRNVTVRNVVVENANDGWGFYADSLADNIQRATVTNQATSGVPYVPTLDPLSECGIILEHCVTASDGGASVLPGFRIQDIRGASLVDCQASGHLWGAVLENAANRVRVLRGRFYQNRNDGIYVNGTSPAKDCSVEEAQCDQNGQDGAYTNSAGVKVDSATRTKVVRCRFGTDYTTETQRLGVHAASTACSLLSLRDNYVAACKPTTGIAYGIGSSTDYGILDVFEGNRADSGVAALYAGANIIPTVVEYGADGVERRKFRAARGALTGAITPSAGTWKLGDTIYYEDPTASDYIGSTCVTAGSPGTWKRFGATTA